MNAIETIGKITNYRRKQINQQNNIKYKSEYDRLIGEISRTAVPYSVRHKTEQRKQTIKQECRDSQLAKNILLT